MAKGKQLAIRFLVAALAGVLVAIIAIIVTWQTSRHEIGLRSEQFSTQLALGQFAQAIDAYKEQTGTVPSSLDDLEAMEEPSLRFSDPGQRMDGWRRPFILETDGKNCLVISYGRDGKPGGAGLDHDLTHVQPRPSGSLPTLLQCISHPTFRPMLAGCAVGGLGAFVLAWFVVKPGQFNRRSIPDVIFWLVVSAIGAAVIGVLHIPSGH